MKITLFECGYSKGPENVVLKGGVKKKLKFPALVGLLKHPEQGYILFDTGYSEKIYKVTAKWPAKLTALLLPTYVKCEESALNRLKFLGISPEEIKYIIVSHFHVDHVCGLDDFPEAKIICSKAAMDNAITAKGFWAITKGVIPSLIPKNLKERAFCFDNNNLKTEKDVILGTMTDLFGDSSIRIIDLPGHHTGQCGLLLKDEKNRELLLCADACWLSASYRENRLPSSMTKLLISDWKAYKESIEMLHHYHKANPELPIIPTHCLSSILDLQKERPEYFEKGLEFA